MATQIVTQMEQQFYLLILRHFKTTKDSKKNEKIIYDDAFDRSESFANFIIIFLKEHPNIHKVKFITSPQDRTIMTALVISSMFKTKIFEDKIIDIEIIDPLIDKMIDRDPHKKKKNAIFKYFKNNIRKDNSKHTLYVYVSHSSIIHNMFKAIVNICSNNNILVRKEHIYAYSLSYIFNNGYDLTYEYNKNM